MRKDRILRQEQRDKRLFLFRNSFIERCFEKFGEESKMADRILVIDDDEMNLKMAEFILKKV